MSKSSDNFWNSARSGFRTGLSLYNKSANRRERQKDRDLREKAIDQRESIRQDENAKYLWENYTYRMEAIEKRKNKKLFLDETGKTIDILEKNKLVGEKEIAVLRGQLAGKDVENLGISLRQIADDKEDWTYNKFLGTALNAVHEGNASEFQGDFVNEYMKHKNKSTNKPSAKQVDEFTFDHWADQIENGMSIDDAPPSMRERLVEYYSTMDSMEKITPKNADPVFKPNDVKKRIDKVYDEMLKNFNDPENYKEGAIEPDRAIAEAQVMREYKTTAGQMGYDTTNMQSLINPETGEQVTTREMAESGIKSIRSRKQKSAISADKSTDYDPELIKMIQDAKSDGGSFSHKKIADFYHVTEEEVKSIWERD